MLIKTGVDTVVLGTAYLLIRERKKPSVTIIWYDKRYLADPTFWSITLCICLCNFGFPVPFFYLPTFAKQKVPNLTELVSIYRDGILAGWRLTVRDSSPPFLSLWSMCRLGSAVAVADSSLIGLGPRMLCLLSS